MKCLHEGGVETVRAQKKKSRHNEYSFASIDIVTILTKSVVLSVY
jgi:hypothetical protein